jgi:hypothetical protein
VTLPDHVTTASALAAASIRPWVTSSRRRRSTKSASAPAGTPRSKTGSEPAVWTRATSAGDSLSSSITHTAPMPCMKVPMFETNWAIHSIRKRRCRNGAHADPRNSWPPTMELGAELLAIADAQPPPGGGLRMVDRRVLSHLVHVSISVRPGTAAMSGPKVALTGTWSSQTASGRPGEHPPGGQVSRCWCRITCLRIERMASSYGKKARARSRRSWAARPGSNGLRTTRRPAGS